MSAADDEALYRALVAADRSEAMAPIAASLAAELNERLTRILSGLELAARAPGESSEALATAAAACGEARELTRRLMRLAQPHEAGRIALAPARILNEAVEAAAVGHVAEVTVAADDAAEPVHGNRDELVQAFRALIRNAAEALTPAPPRPQIQLAARGTALAEGEIEGLAAGPYVEFEVRDNGSGIAPENLDKIWEPFFTTRKHGAGLGLPTVLATVRRHGGQVGVDSVVGQGTVFTIFLPAARPPARAGGDRSEATRFRTGRILVMDDDADARELAGKLLDRLAYKCDLARDPEEAVGWYRRYLEVSRPYDAVILDLECPRPGAGEEALARLRELDPDVRAIALSPRDPESVAESAKSAGFAGWLAKPFKLSELAEALQAVV